MLRLPGVHATHETTCPQHGDRYLQYEVADDPAVAHSHQAGQPTRVDDRDPRVQRYCGRLDWSEDMEE